MRQLVVDDTHYFMDTVTDTDGEHYIKDGITTVIDLRKPLIVAYDNTISHVHPALLQLSQDPHGNELVTIPLATDIMLFMRGLFHIDKAFITRFKDTSLYELVRDKEGCYAVSGFEIIHRKPIA